MAIKPKNCALPRPPRKAIFVNTMMTIVANAMILIIVAVLWKVWLNVIGILEFGSCFQLSHLLRVQANRHHPNQWWLSWYNDRRSRQLYRLPFIPCKKQEYVSMYLNVIVYVAKYIRNMFIGLD
jgi:hypothetical protein